MNREIHECEERVVHLRKEKDIFRASEKEIDEDRKRISHSLQGKVQDEIKNNELLEKKIEEHHETLKQLAASVQNIYFQASCQQLMDAMESKGSF